MRILSSFAIGLLFGLGLVISQMVNPAKIIGFLDVAGDWDPSLIIVMAVALLTTLVGYRVVLARPKPLLEEEFSLSVKTVIDRPLLIGAGVFGVGWGMAGFCPGPAISAAAIGGAAPWVFIAAMLAGMLVRRFVRV